MKIARLHYITQDLEDISHYEQADRACVGGAKWVQFRTKIKDELYWSMEGAGVRMVCDNHNAKMIVNDHPELAKELLADGVHLGQNDMSPVEARKILGPDAIIGGTANTFEQVQQMVADGVDYVGVGPYTKTKTKKKLSPIIGLSGFEEIVKKCEAANITIPIIAIGGIQHDDVDKIMNVGVHGIAVSSAINKAEDSAESAAKFIQKLEKQLA